MRVHRRPANPLRIVTACAALGAAALLVACSPQGSSAPSSRTDLGRTTTTVGDTPTPVAILEPTATVPYIPQIAPTAEEAKAALREGRSLFDAGEFATAAAELQLAAAGMPDDPRVHYLLGLALWKGGEAALAEPALERVTLLDPKSVKGWTNLARVRLELDEAKTALEAADAAIAIEPLSAPALHQRGRALALLSRTEEALEALRLALELDPANGYVANTLGYWLIQRGRPAEAVPLLEEARDRLPAVAFVRNNLGVAYERTGRIEEAKGEYLAAVESGDAGGKAGASLARLGGAPTEGALAELPVPAPRPDDSVQASARTEAKPPVP